MESNTAASEASISDRRTFKTKKFCVCNELLECFRDGLFCDVILITDDGKRISAHRLVLYAASTFFRTMLKAGWKEGNQSEIAMKDLDGDILEQLVKNCYTGEVEIGSDNVHKLTSAATMLQFTDVQKHCTTFYSRTLEASNCLRIREIAEVHNMVRLKERAQAFVLDYFVEVSSSPEFYDLNVDKLSELLEDDRLNIAAEEDVFAALMGWAKHDVYTRKQSLQSLLKCIRFQHVKDSFLLDVAYKQCIEIDSPELFAMVVACRSGASPNEISRSKVQLHLLYDAGADMEIEKYHPQRNMWTGRQSFGKIGMECFTVVHRDGKLIFIGGRDAQKTIINTVKSVDLTSKEVIEMPPMISPRFNLLSEMTNNSIYVFGGWNQLDKIVRTVEKFDFGKNEWSVVAPMNKPRSDSAHLVMTGHIFVIGGKDDGGMAYNLVEYYDPFTNKWQKVAPMRRRRSDSAAYITNGCIYVLGGIGDGEDDILQTIERYSPREDSWTELQFVLPVPRYWTSPGVGDGDWIYLAGGVDKEQADVAGFEKINVVTGELIKLKDLTRPWLGCHLLKF